jgi:DNA-binding transcriptional LysR family regulator
MNLEQINTFLTVYQMGSYTKAAEQLYLPQPTISHRISQLEKDLGKSLLIRGKRSVKLTEEGKAFLPHAQRILVALQKGKEAVESIGQGDTGTLSIGCNNSFAHALPEIMDSFTAEYPHISIKLYCYPTKELIRMMKNQTFQLCITRYASNDNEIVYRPVHSEQTMLFIAPEHRFANRTSISLDELSKEPLVQFTTDSQYQKMIDLTLSQFNLNYHAKYETNNLQLIKHFVKRNMGVCLAGNMTMSNEVKQKELLQLEIEHNPFPSTQVFVACLDRELNSLDYLFIKHFEEGINNKFEFRNSYPVAPTKTENHKYYNIF